MNDRLARQRASQGLPATVEDASVLAKIAEIVVSRAEVRATTPDLDHTTRRPSPKERFHYASAG